MKLHTPIFLVAFSATAFGPPACVRKEEPVREKKGEKAAEAGKDADAKAEVVEAEESAESAD